MTLLGIQQRFREVGRIRTGERVERGGKTYPHRLDTFRLTSTDKAAIDAAAVKYGGTVKSWESGWQVTTEADRIEVMLPPRSSVEPYSLHYELWSGGGIQRRCDGTHALIGGADGFCVCDPDARECAPTLRVAFLLPDLPGLGVWRLETKSFNAAAELPGALNLLAGWSDEGRPVRAVLRLETREAKRDGQKRVFTVPVLDPYGTINELLLARQELPSVPQLASSSVTDDLPLLPHEIEPSEADVREAPSVGSTPPSDEASAPSGTDAGGAAAPSESPPAPDIGKRYEWAASHGWDAAALDDHAVAAFGSTVMEQTPEEWAIFARTIKDGPAQEPPRPKTDEYRALSPIGKANARAYWEAKDE